MKDMYIVKSSKGIVCLFLLFTFRAALFASTSEECPLIPYPQFVEKVPADFHLSSITTIVYEQEEISQLAYFLQKELLRFVGIPIKLNATDQNKRNTIVLTVSSSMKQQPNGSFTLKMSNNEVVISAASNEGVFYGISTLLQLVRLSKKNGREIKMTCWNIEDTPKYVWRGLMLDESRHFFGKEKVKMLLDWMAMYKLNRFHWHLTDSPGWRIEIQQYPKLALVGGIGNYYNEYTEARFYSQEDIKEIVRYASERFIEIIPEIDMPGHATAANRAYPEFSGGGSDRYPDFTFNPGNDSVYTFLTNILREVDALFPSQIIHLGGDEVHYGNEKWIDDKHVKKLMERESLLDLKEVENYFFKRMSDSMLVINNKVAAWDEVADSELPVDNTIVFYWRDRRPEQLQKSLDKGFSIVLCPRHPMYFDYMQDTIQVYGPHWKRFSINSYEMVYNFRPSDIPVDYPENANILGLQANVWTERIVTEQRLDYMIFPRIAALSETTWTKEDNKNIDKFNKRLKKHFELYRENDVYYFDPFNHMNTGEPVK